MNRLTLAGGAALAAATIAVPVLARSADSERDSAAMAAAGVATPAFDLRDQAGDPGGRGGMDRWMRRVMAQSPEQACIERLARRAGFIAYIGAKLNLTAAQKPLWDQLQTTLQASRDKQRELCDAIRPAGELTVLDRLQHREQVLQTQLQAVQQAQPQVKALYEALTPEQRAIVDRSFRRG